MNKEQKEMLRKSFIELMDKCSENRVFEGEDQGILVIHVEKRDEGFAPGYMIDGNGWLVAEAMIDLMGKSPEAKVAFFEATRFVASGEMELINEQERVKNLPDDYIN